MPAGDNDSFWIQGRCTRNDHPKMTDENLLRLQFQTDNRKASKTLRLQ